MILDGYHDSIAALHELALEAQGYSNVIVLLQAQLATARADTLREVREKVEKLETHGVLPSASFGRAFAGVDRDAVLALLTP